MSVNKLNLEIITFHHYNKEVKKSENAIEVRDLIKRYNKASKNAVESISFSVVSGEFFSLLGPNGAGKTTTISILTTILNKTSGHMTVAGYDLDKNPKEVRKHIGIIFQNPSLDQNLTAEENVRFHVSLYGIYPFSPFYGMMPEKYKKKITDLSAILGIEKEIFNPIKSFSGGMRRKLEIVRSLMHNPKILFLDEPTTGLDPLSRKNLWEYLQNVRKKEHITIFLTTHYLEEAEDADHVAVIDNGKIVSFGTPNGIKKDLIEEYLLINSPDPILLEKELISKKITYKKEKGMYKINIKSNSVHRLLASIKTPLSIIKTHTPTLEEAYLEIVNQTNHERT